MPKIGYKQTTEHKKNSGLAHSGENHPMFGKKQSEESNRKRSLTIRKRIEELGYMNSPKAREKISKALLGKKSNYPAYNKGKTYEEIFGIEKANEIKNKLTLANKDKKLSPERIRKSLQRREMSYLEIKMNEIIQKNNLPYKFVGNGDFMIERKCPDFVNTNGEKKVIEVFGTRHKNRFRSGGVDSWMKERSELFSKYGYKTIFFNEKEVSSENTVLKKLI